MHYFLFLHCMLCSFPHIYVFTPSCSCLPKGCMLLSQISPLLWPSWADEALDCEWCYASSVAVFAQALSLLDSLGPREERKFNYFEKRPRYPPERTKCLLWMLIFLEREASRMKSAIRNADSKLLLPKDPHCDLGVTVVTTKDCQWWRAPQRQP